MINKAWDRIRKEDVENLVAEKIPENNTLDYKQELPNESPKSELDFLFDVISFANASGGDLIFGISEKREEGKPTAIPEGFVGLRKRGTWDEAKRRLESLILNGVEPRLSVKINDFNGLPEGPVLIVRVPASWAAPHMVTRYSKDLLRPQFYRRHNGGNHPMNIDEIRAAFALSENRYEKLRRFREDRISVVSKQDEAAPNFISSRARLVCHLLPISAFEARAAVDISTLENRKWGPSAAFLSHNARLNQFNFDGYLIRDFLQTTNKLYAYTQIFRSGAIESVFVLKEEQYINNTFELVTIRRVKDLLKIQRELDVQTPVVLMLTLVGVKDYALIGPPNSSQGGPPNEFDRDILPLPECVIDDFDSAVENILRPAFDALYQAAGSPRSANYDQNGNWIGGDVS